MSSSKIEGELGVGHPECSSSERRSDGRCDWNHRLTGICRTVEHHVPHCLLRDWLGAGHSGSSDDAVCSVCTTQCMLYSVFAVFSVDF